MSDNDYELMRAEIRRLHRVCQGKDRILRIAIETFWVLAKAETISEELRTEISNLSKSLEESLG